jgi:hypothetical protein
MNLSQFLIQAQQPKFFESHTVIAFCGQSYPLLFFSLIHNRLKEQNGNLFATIDMLEEDQASILAKLQTSFLGQSIVYFLKNFDELGEKEKQHWFSLLQHYQGPNCIMVYVSDVLTKQQDPHAIIILDPLIDQKNFLQLLHFFDAAFAINKKELVTFLFAQSPALPLDTACLLMHYIRVLGNSAAYFIKHWFSKIVIPEKSLFTLSTYFFAKQQKSFFQLWKEAHIDYSDQFWIAYWSEQLWRAYHYIELSEGKQVAQAKKISSRLPFSFMQRDWKKYKLDELQAAHSYIYELDYALKNGGSSYGLDLFYAKFFTKEFGKN